MESTLSPPIGPCSLSAMKCNLVRKGTCEVFRTWKAEKHNTLFHMGCPYSMEYPMESGPTNSLVTKVNYTHGPSTMFTWSTGSFYFWFNQWDPSIVDLGCNLGSSIQKDVNNDYLIQCLQKWLKIRKSILFLQAFFLFKMYMCHTSTTKSILIIWYHYGLRAECKVEGPH